MSLRQTLEHIRLDVRIGWRHLLELVDSRTVRLFQAIVYTFCVIAGIYAVFWSEPLSVVSVAMGDATYTAWIWLNIICPVTVAWGCYLARDQGRPYPTRNVANGMVFQLCGNAGMMFTFGAYVSALWTSAWWGKGTYALFILAALTLCAGLLIIGDVRRLKSRGVWRK